MLNGGFTKPFDYEVFDIPETRKLVGIREDPDMRDEGIVKGRTQLPGIPDRWPAQFDPKFFQKAGFLYAIKEPMFTELETKKDLIKACRKHKLKNFTWWSSQPVKLFKRWMENAMAGRKAEERGELAPYPGIVGAASTKKISSGSKSSAKNATGKKVKAKTNTSSKTNSKKNTQTKETKKKKAAKSQEPYRVLRPGLRPRRK